MDTILAVDDNIINLKSIKRLLSSKYKVIPVTNVSDALKYLKMSVPDLILLDVLMSDIDGFEMMRRIKSDSRLSEIPVIFLTGDMDKEREVEGFKLGADDFIHKPFEPEVVLSRISRTLELDKLRHTLEAEVAKKAQEIENITLQSIMAVANVVDSKDIFAKNHSTEVAIISEEIARRMGWDNPRVENLHYAALLHDIGMIGVADTILNKPGALTEEEFRSVKNHTELGAEILETISIVNAREGALYHHERYDGSGYGMGISGEDIPIVARIIAVADAYDAMSKDRAYRKKLTREQIIEEFTKESGKQFDPEIAKIMINIIKEGKSYSSVISDNVNKKISIIGESTLLLQKVMSEYAVDANNDRDK